MGKSKILRFRADEGQLEFLEMVRRKTGLSMSESIRLIINMFRLLLTVDERVGIIDYDKLEKEIRRRLAEKFGVSEEEVDKVIEEMESERGKRDKRAKKKA